MFFNVLFPPFIGIVFLTIFLSGNTMLHSQIKKIFFILIGLELIELFVFGLELWTAGFDQPTLLRTALSVIGYGIRPLILYLILVLTFRNKKIHSFLILLSFPLVINSIVVFSAFFSDAAFRYNDQNQFVRGPLGYTTHITLIFYLLVLGLTAIFEYRKREHFESWIIIAIVISLIASLVMETAFHAVQLGRMVIVYSPMFYYMYFLTNTYRTNLHISNVARQGIETQSKLDPLPIY